MPATQHVERHFLATETVRDIVIGMSDGLTVPFALAAGLSGAVHASSIIITAGLAEIAAGSMAMGLGGYLAARTDAEHYDKERLREAHEVETIPGREAQEIVDIFAEYGVAAEAVQPLVTSLRKNKQGWIDLMMRFELGLEKPEPKRALVSAVTIALSYIGGGIIPLSPYVFISSIGAALWVSVAVTLAALFVFGYLKGRLTGTAALRSALQTALVGGLAAAAAFLLARLFS